MRTHYCGELRADHIDQEVELCGWVHRRRDHGGVIFLDVRDVDGIAQVVFNPDRPESFAMADRVRSEYVIRAKGKVRHRPDGTVNPDMPTGEVEVDGVELEILNKAETPPFPLDEHHTVSEEVRLKHRYIDLRRPEVLQNFKLRADMNRVLRNFLADKRFIEFETPILTKATPEGARDYLVPSRVHRGEFFALPQSPQIFKQLLMMAGVDRYYQIVRCFRDEDLRADRQPEFTQLDLETSFMDKQAIQDLMEEMLCHLFKQVLGVELSSFPRMTYHDAITKYGSDRPDLRVPLELIEIADLVKDVEFKVFSAPANDANGRVVALRLPAGCDKLTRKQIDDYTDYVIKLGAKGLAYIKVNDRSQGVEGLQSPILKFLPEDVVNAILDRVDAVTGDIVFFGAGKAKDVNETIGSLREKLGRDLNLLQGEWAPLWVVDFPMFEREHPKARWTAVHHPFTMPTVNDVVEIGTDPAALLSHSYDITLNGYEIGGGSIRIHEPEMQYAVFEVLGIGKVEAEEKFSHLLNALRYGCPPLGGLALGLDRVAMLMAGGESIRDVIAFPKTQTATCPLTNAPSAASFDQLQELGIAVKKEPVPA